MKPDQRGLLHKFNVERTDGSSAPDGKHHGCDYFVLDMTHDKHAIPALTAYAIDARKERPALVADLVAKYGLKPPSSTGIEAAKFVKWWRDDVERAKCTLEQAIGAYCSTFPGRLFFLLVELLEHLR